MSDELSIYAGMLFEKGGATVMVNEAISVDVSGDDATQTTQNIGTTEETLNFPGEIATAGYLFIKNLDSTNYVEFGVTTGVYTVKCKAGEIALFRSTGTTIYAKANTAAVNVQVTFIED
jgi:hypothetical protein